MSHGLDSQWLQLLLLSIGLTVLYAWGSLFLARSRFAGTWLVTVILLWGILTFMAPSFAWCAFPLFFACRHILRGWEGRIALGFVVVVMIAALTRLTGGPDITFIVGPLAVGALMLAVYNRIEQDSLARQRLLEELTAAQDRLKTSQKREGALAERERLAREIHDTVAQGLTQSLLLLEAADQVWASRPEAARDNLLAATCTVRDNLVEARSLVHDLSSPHLENRSLPEALRAVTADIVGLQQQVTGVAYPLVPEANHALLRIAQSAAANIRRHSGADTVVLTLSYLPDGVNLDIFDNGRGFDTALKYDSDSHGGYGLRAMRQRAEQLGGTFTVESVPGEGSVVAVHLPRSLEQTP